MNDVYAESQKASARHASGPVQNIWNEYSSRDEAFMSPRNWFTW